MGGYTKKKNVTVQQLIDKLANYEDLAEKGLLVELPCNYSDKMFWIVKGRIKEVFSKEYVAIKAINLK